MGAVYFYHLTQHPLETTLPVLLQKAVAAPILPDWHG